jgi:hypothetical protein
MTCQGLAGMDQTIPISAYPNTMFLTIMHHHHTAAYRYLNINNITRYLRVIMLGAYDTPTKDVLTSIDPGTLAIQDQAAIGVNSVDSSMKTSSSTAFQLFHIVWGGLCCTGR